jgi:hypothetical protein
MTVSSIGADQPQERRDRIPIIQGAIEESIALVERYFPNSVEAFQPAAAIVTSNCYFLLSNAYKRKRLIGDNRTYDFKVAALTAAAIMSVRPIRFKRIPRDDQEMVRFVNWDCATRASLSLLQRTLAKTDPEFIKRFHRATLGTIRLSCLNTYLQQFHNLVFLSDRRGNVTFDEVEAAVPFANFNNVDLAGRHLMQMEDLINMYFLFKHSSAMFHG